MTKKTQQLRIRISESQFKKVAEALVSEKRNKSALVRKAIDCYLEERYNNNDLENKQK